MRGQWVLSMVQEWPVILFYSHICVSHSVIYSFGNMHFIWVSIICPKQDYFYFARRFYWKKIHNLFQFCHYQWYGSKQSTSAVFTHFFSNFGCVSYESGMRNSFQTHLQKAIASMVEGSYFSYTDWKFERLKNFTAAFCARTSTSAIENLEDYWGNDRHIKKFESHIFFWNAATKQCKNEYIWSIDLSYFVWRYYYITRSSSIEISCFKEIYFQSKNWIV